MIQKDLAYWTAKCCTGKGGAVGKTSGGRERAIRCHGERAVTHALRRRFIAIQRGRNVETEGVVAQISLEIIILSHGNGGAPFVAPAGKGCVMGEVSDIAIDDRMVGAVDVKAQRQG